jgi:hypothetical protein
MKINCKILGTAPFTSPIVYNAYVVNGFVCDNFCRYAAFWQFVWKGNNEEN